MAYPNLYDVTYSYTGFQEAQGDNSFPGTQLDSDLAGLETSIGNISTFIRSVMRSDGQLQNSIVTYDSLAPSLLTMLDIAALPPGDPAGLFLVTDGAGYSARAVIPSDLPLAAVLDAGAVFALPVTSNSVLSGIGVDGTPTRATTTGTGAVVRAVSPSITGSFTITGVDAHVFSVGRLGSTTPAFDVDASQANSITGLRIRAQAAGNGVNLEAMGETNVPLIIDGRGTGTINFGVASTGDIVMFRNVVSNGAHSINGQMAARTIKGNNTVGAALSTDLTPQQVAVLLGVTRQAVSLAAVNFNSANSDNVIALPAPPAGYTRYSLRAVYISGASATLNPATCGVFTAAAAGGTALVASATALAVTATADSTNNNMQVLTPVNVNAMSNLYSALTTGNLYFRVQTASGAPATATVTVEIQWLP